MSKLPPGRFYSPVGGEVAGSDYGYVNPHGVLFPVGHKFRGGHISTWDIVLLQCPKCQRRMNATHAVKGVCESVECGYSQIDELDAIDSI